MPNTNPLLDLADAVIDHAQRNPDDPTARDAVVGLLRRPYSAYARLTLITMNGADRAAWYVLRDKIRRWMDTPHDAPRAVDIMRTDMHQHEIETTGDDPAATRLATTPADLWYPGWVIITGLCTGLDPGRCYAHGDDPDPGLPAGAPPTPRTVTGGLFAVRPQGDTAASIGLVNAGAVIRATFALPVVMHIGR